MTFLWVLGYLFVGSIVGNMANKKLLRATGNEAFAAVYGVFSIFIWPLVIVFWLCSLG